MQQYDGETVTANTENVVVKVDTNNITQTAIVEAVSQINDALKVVSYENDELTNAIKSKSKINGLKAIFASKGTSLLAIATEADLSLSKLLELNDLKTDGILTDDQIIYLEKKNKQGKRDAYIAEQNVRLYDIAQNNAIQLKALAVLNNMGEHETIKKGTKIILR